MHPFSRQGSRNSLSLPWFFLKFLTSVSKFRLIKICFLWNQTTELRALVFKFIVPGNSFFDPAGPGPGSLPEITGKFVRVENVARNVSYRIILQDCF